MWGPDLGLAGDESTHRVDGDPRLLAVLGEARAHASALMGIAPDAADADRVSRAIPKLVWTAPAADGGDGIQGPCCPWGAPTPRWR